MLKKCLKTHYPTIQKAIGILCSSRKNFDIILWSVCPLKPPKDRLVRKILWKYISKPEIKSFLEQLKKKHTYLASFWGILSRRMLNNFGKVRIHCFGLKKGHQFDVFSIGKPWFDNEKIATQYFIKSSQTQCGKTRNSLPCKFFSSNEFRVKFFSQKLLSRNFCEKMVAVISTLCTATVWKLREFFLTHFGQKFRESSSFTN